MSKSLLIEPPSPSKLLGGHRRLLRDRHDWDVQTLGHGDFHFTPLEQRFPRAQAR